MSTLAESNARFEGAKTVIISAVSRVLTKSGAVEAMVLTSEVPYSESARLLTKCREASESGRTSEGSGDVLRELESTIGQLDQDVLVLRAS